MLVWMALWAALLTPSSDQARALYQAGGRAYRAGNYAIAIDAFESARAISERDVVVFALAQAYRLRYFERGALSDLEAAIAAYRRYLELTPQGPRRIHATQHLSVLEPFLERKAIEAASANPAPPKARLIVTSAVDDAEARVDDGPPQPVPATFEVEPGPHRVTVSAALHRDATRETAAVADSAVAVALNPSPVPGTVTIRAPGGARVSLDQATLPRHRLAMPVEVLPGAHTLLARAPGHRPRQERFEIRSGEALAVDLALEPTTQRMFAWGAFGAAGLLATSGIITGVIALDAQSDARALEERLGAGLTGAEFDEHDRLRARRDDYSSATLILGITTGAALLGGVLLWMFDDPPAPPSVPVAPTEPPAAAGR